MKKILYILSVLAFGLVSCSQEIEIPDVVPADCIVLNVYNSPMTKAITDLSGTEYERQLNRLDCFFYPKGKTGEACVYYQKVEYSTPADRSASIPFYVDESVIETIFPSQDECDVFIIANLPDGTYAKGQAGTDVPTLSKKVLTLGGERDAVGKPFVMAGLDIATKGEENNASGTIPLHRAAAKITVSVSIPAQIQITSGEATETMVPVLTDDEGEVTLKTAFHNGVSKTYLRSDYSSKIKAEDFIHTAKAGYDFVVETPATESVPAKYLYTCEIPFYTYARAWEKGAEDAAYLTFEMPWTNQEDQSTQTYYYQILINGSDRNFSPNNWYDLTVNVGVIGSTVESEPVPLKDLSYYILDWTTEPESETGDRYEDVDIQKYTYLVVPEKKIVINNASSAKIRYSASHTIGVMMDGTSKPTEIVDSPINTTKSAYYINCRSNPPILADLNPAISANNFAVKRDKDGNETGELIFTHPIPDNVYSPIFVYATIWLDFDNDGNIDDDESEFVENISIVQYPPMYIIPDATTLKSVYVNGVKHTNSSDSYNVSYNGHGLGNASGLRDSGDNAVYSMYTIAVTAFGADDKFVGPKLNADGSIVTPIENNTQQYPYIIGDPRQRWSDIELDYDDRYDMTQHWEDGTKSNSAYAIKLDETTGEYILDQDGEFQYETGKRSLTYYYPTATGGNSFQIVAPKFRIVSYNNASRKLTTPHGAAMRCATVQEDGYPAGRWRLPTIAEIQYVIKLQQEEAIQDIFLSGSSYYATSTYGNEERTTRVTLTEGGNGDTDGDGFTFTHNRSTSISVRCVYDEWYWGSEKEAMKNPAANPATGSEYLFTWGDKKIW